MNAAPEAIGPKIRRQRRRLGLTLDELAGRTSISKPYLSLIETGRVPNPPSDSKLRKLEQSLGFAAGELITQAHLQRTPRDVRVILQKLLKNVETAKPGAADSKSATKSAVIDLDDAYLNGKLQEMVDRTAGNIEAVQTNVVPVINRVSAGYPSDFTDLSYPPRVADDYVGCPDVHDADAFAARVHGDSMTPKYREGDIVIFSPAAPLRDGHDCFVRFADGHTTFKRVFFESSDAGQSMVRLQPRNEKYRPQTVEATNISGMYRAVYRYQELDEE